MDKDLHKYIKVKALKKRHKVYSLALREYKRYQWVPTFLRPHRVRKGLCHYLEELLDLDYSHEVVEYLDKEPLYAFHNLYGEGRMNWPARYYWFKPGELEPRIRILTEAIRLIEHQLKEMGEPLN